MKPPQYLVKANKLETKHVAKNERNRLKAPFNTFHSGTNSSLLQYMLLRGCSDKEYQS